MSYLFCHCGLSLVSLAQSAQADTPATLPRSPRTRWPPARRRRPFRAVLTGVLVVLSGFAHNLSTNSPPTAGYSALPDSAALRFLGVNASCVGLQLLLTLRKTGQHFLKAGGAEGVPLTDPGQPVAELDEVDFVLL